MECVESYRSQGILLQHYVDTDSDDEPGIQPANTLLCPGCGMLYENHDFIYEIQCMYMECECGTRFCAECGKSSESCLHRSFMTRGACQFYMKLLGVPTQYSCLSQLPVFLFFPFFLFWRSTIIFGLGNAIKFMEWIGYHLEKFFQKRREKQREQS